MTDFGWHYPPGVTPRDIDRQFEDEPEPDPAEDPRDEYDPDEEEEVPE